VLPEHQEVLMPTPPIEEVVGNACARAARVAESFSESAPTLRAELLDAVAALIDAAAADLIPITEVETNLPQERLRGELARTTGQLRYFARHVRTADKADIRIDEADPARTPVPKPELRQRAIALGPVAVFGASNFPYAFSTAGGDTASALAAGCPVVLKAHPAHPLTSDRVADCVRRALVEVGLPEEIFTHIAGGIETGTALARDPRIQAIAFTGSRSAGLALQEIGQCRRPPIPVFAEMSSINPVLVFPAATVARPGSIAQTFAQSLTNGVGQFCTNPGLVLLARGTGLDTLLEQIAGAVSSQPALRMLTSNIGQTYNDALARRRAHEQVSILALGSPGADPLAAQVAVLQTSAHAFCADKGLHAEIFGPASLIVICDSVAEFDDVLRKLEGQLTVTFFADVEDYAHVSGLLPRAERLAARIVCNQWPTGVEVSDAMVHGGPWPATSDGRSTSVGALAIERFRRPVSYQNFPDDLLPMRARARVPSKQTRPTKSGADRMSPAVSDHSAEDRATC
jgi:NADP-dependent aldehyde dehydrogenase